ncbi:DUF4124 domain-containing protein [Arenimonas sp. MALMAid1274]|uniref:DUF4124 domain-containing protein n=1 Tax=Arenimonas sp. MALMAid1274 TaxID=3411630 RepID=UPI003B9EF723
MTRTFLSVAVLSALLAAGIAGAQEKPKKLYRWVDKDGKVQFSDALPPEAVDQARTEINPESGMATATIERALTPEERKARELAQAHQEQADKQAEKVRQTEEAMIASFQTEDELKRAFQVRTSMLQQTLDAIEAGIGGQRASLASLLADASEAELSGTAVNPKQAATIRELHLEMNKQTQMLVLKQGELVALDKELLRLVERFREIKAPRDGAAPAAPSAPAEAGAPPTG